MPAPSYLLKSHHGVYYFRIRVAGFVRDLTHKSAGEIRVSLNTRDKTVALYLSRRLWIAMKEKSLANTSIELEEWDLAADIERQRYFQGKDLIESFGRADPTDAFALDCLSEHLSNDELKSYVFAWDHDEQHRQNKRRDTAQLFAQATVGSGLLTRASPAPHDACNVSCDNDAALQEAITRFLSAGVRAPATIRSYRSRLALFQYIITAHLKGRESHISQITPEMIRQYADHVRRLPKNFEVGSGVKLSSVLVESGTGISQKTISFHFGVVRSLLLWLEDQQYPIQPNLARIFGTLKVPSKRKRFPFERSELKILFESTEYLSGTFKRAGDYWVPLIGLFTGARESDDTAAKYQFELHYQYPMKAMIYCTAKDI